MDFKKPVYFSTISSGIGLILPFVFPHMLSIILSQLICGLAFTVFVISLQRYAGIAFGMKKRDAAIAQFSLGIAIGSFIGPLFAGILSDLFNYFLAFNILGCVIFISVFFVISLSYQREKITQSTLKSTIYPASTSSVRARLKLLAERSALFLEYRPWGSKCVFPSRFIVHVHERIPQRNRTFRKRLPFLVIIKCINFFYIIHLYPSFSNSSLS